MTVDAMRAWHQGRIDQFTTRITLSPDELVGGSDWAVDRFSFTIALAPKAGGAAIEDHGNCVWVWKRSANGGAWKVARAIWNSAKPMA